MVFFSRCCAREEEVDVASLRRSNRTIKRLVVGPNTSCSSSESASTGYESDASSVSSGVSSTVSTKEMIEKKLSDALKLKDDEGNIVASPMESLEQAKGVLENFTRPEIQEQVANLVTSFLFSKGDQKLFVSSCSEGNIALSEKDHKPERDTIFQLSGSHEYIEAEGVNQLEFKQELQGMLKLEELFKFVRNLNEIASNSDEPVYEEDLMEALGELLPQLSKLLGLITEEDSGDIWLERDEATNSIHIRFEAILDLAKIGESEYSSIAESLSRAHKVDLRMMQMPVGCEDATNSELRSVVKDMSLNEFNAGMLVKILSTKHASPDGKARKKKSQSNTLLRVDFAIESDGTDLLWMDPQTCLPRLDANGQCMKVDFDETDTEYTGRCLVGFELVAGVSELGCGSLGMPKTIAVVNYQAEEAFDGGCAASITAVPIYIDWNRYIRFMARPLINLNKLESLLMNEFEFNMKIGPGSNLQDSIERHGVTPGYGLFPDVPADTSPWSLFVQCKAKMVRPASIVTSFIRSYVSSQVSEMGEITFFKDLTVAFVSDLQTLCA